ncbi:MAG: hypothetical protein IJ435_10125 [Clostridia bacterium]|nr:hypothetical protein [Clostridia bacterium]
MKNRNKQRANRKLKIQEEMLDKRNSFGIKDLTAYNAVQQLCNGNNPTIVLK